MSEIQPVSCPPGNIDVLDQSIHHSAITPISKEFEETKQAGNMAQIGDGLNDNQIDVGKSSDSATNITNDKNTSDACANSNVDTNDTGDNDTSDSSSDSSDSTSDSDSDSDTSDSTSDTSDSSSDSSDSTSDSDTSDDSQTGSVYSFGEPIEKSLDQKK